MLSVWKVKCAALCLGQDPPIKEIFNLSDALLDELINKQIDKRF